MGNSWRSFSYSMPAGKKFTVRFLNDDSGRDVYICSNLAFDIQRDDDTWHNIWHCGSETENERCQIVHDGTFAWSATYYITIQGIIIFGAPIPSETLESVK